jgi:hypothetical protein
MARALGALAVVAVALGYMAGSASAGPQQCNGTPGSRANICLHIPSTGNGNFYNVHVGVEVHMSRADAQALINQPGDPFTVRLMGSDSGSGDDFLGFVPMTAIGASDDFGLNANFDQFTDRFHLNEDDSIFNDIDEVYVEIRMVDRDRGTSTTFRSDTIVQIF